MRLHPFVAAAVVLSAVLTGCSSGSETPSGSSSAAPASAAPATTSTTLETHTATAGAMGLSPAGVTTAVGEPAASTEDEYFQACHAAKTWMAEQGGDPKAQFEPYLAELQKSDSAGVGTFNTPWSQLPPNRQAAVIVAADAASDALCG